MNEKELERSLCDKLSAAIVIRKILKEIKLHNQIYAHEHVGDLYDLIREEPYEKYCDTSAWRKEPAEFPQDIAGAMTPDIVIRASDGENRIHIEVKRDAPMTRTGDNYPAGDSQMLRYFLHLLATSTERCPIRRAVLLAAPPPQWFEEARNRRDWNYFLRTYADLARIFDITLGEIILAH